MSNPKVQSSPRATAPKQAEPSQLASSSTFSDEQIRVRAYQIYESSNRTNQHPDADWFQAETELMELEGGK